METWELLPRRGNRSGHIELLIGMTRTAARDTLAGTMAGPDSHFPDEDDFTADQTGTLIRLRYVDDLLDDIEFLDRDLRFNGIALHRGAQWPTLEIELAAHGFTFRDASHLGEGHECTALGVNIATHEEVGGDGPGIEWVILSAEIAA